MKFSIIYQAQMVDTSRAAEQRCFFEMIEQAKLAEAVGFDTIWAVEHTALTQYAHMSAPETFLAFLAGGTTTIGIGHGVVCLPPAMNHPVKVAERIATLDILSQGRVHFGMGKGGTQQEAGTFGYEVSELEPRAHEAMYLIPKIMVQDEIEHDGEYIKIPRRPIHPKPFQVPHPPLYYACTRDASVAFAGSRGIGALVLGFGGPDEIASKNALYRQAFRARQSEDQVGFRPTEHLAAFCAAVVLDDRDEARRIGLRGQRFFAESIDHWYLNGPRPQVSDLSADENAAALDANCEALVGHLTDRNLVVATEDTHNYTVPEDAYGTPADCLRYCRRLEAAGADEVLFLLQMGSIPHDAILQSIRNIGEHVIPHFRSEQYATMTAE